MASSLIDAGARVRVRADPGPASGRRPRVAAARPANGRFEALAWKATASTPRRVLAVAGLKIGQMAGKPGVRGGPRPPGGHRRLRNRGLQVRRPTRGQRLRRQFPGDRGRSLPVRFDDLGVPDGDWKPALHARDPLFSMARLAATSEVIGRWTKSISEYLAARESRGKILGSVEPWPDQLAMVFRPARNLPAVAEVSFEGNHSALRQRLAARPLPCGGRRPVHRGEFPRFPGRLGAPGCTRRSGRMRVTFPQVRTDRSPVVGLHVFVTVNEGEDYKFGKVALAAPSPLPAQELSQPREFKSGDPADFDRVTRAWRRSAKPSATPATSMRRSTPSATTTTPRKPSTWPSAWTPARNTLWASSRWWG